MMQDGIFQETKGYILQAGRTPFETVTAAIPLKIFPPMGYIYLGYVPKKHVFYMILSVFAKKVSSKFAYLAIK